MYAALQILADRSKLAVQTLHLTNADLLNHQQLHALGATMNVKPSFQQSDRLSAVEIKPGTQAIPKPPSMQMMTPPVAKPAALPVAKPVTQPARAFAAMR